MRAEIARDDVVIRVRPMVMRMCGQPGAMAQTIETTYYGIVEPRKLSGIFRASANGTIVMSTAGARQSHPRFVRVVGTTLRKNCVDSVVKVSWAEV